MNTCGLCERELEDGYLCPGCATSTTARLQRLPDLYEALAAFLTPGRRGGGQAARAGRAGASLPVAEDALGLRGPGGMVGVLEDWRSAMQADRGWKEPAAAGLLEQRVVRAARGLVMNMDWIAASWPLAGAFAEEIRDLVRDVESIVDPPDPRERGMRLGFCPAVYEDGALCGSVLRLYPGEKTVTCRFCGAVYPQATWLGLKALMDEDAAARAAANWLAAATG
ncbi:hypothetical protein [Streptomyces tremellae]|uniref:Uncharacterized protein n=1 Tax=Streptomyces tremellae TaxID=1124239 RepID=A0ABP7EY26_9ACTN